MIHSPDTTLENETPENTESENDSMSESEESGNLRVVYLGNEVMNFLLF